MRPRRRERLVEHLCSYECREAGRSRAAYLFPRHARIDVGTGALCGAPRKAMPLIQASAPKEPDDVRREALLLWLWRALRQGARDGEKVRGSRHCTQRRPRQDAHERR